MFGFALGTACLLGLIFVVARRPRWGFGRWHGRHHAGHALNRLLGRLDTTPAQEKVIRESLQQLRDPMQQARSEIAGTRHEIARALQAESIDQALLQEVFARHAATLSRFRDAVLGALGKAHETLDPRQRQIASQLIESPPWGFGCGARDRGC